MSSISLAMIVRNEEENLAYCLSHIHNAVDEIVIVDTGSSDNTIAIARNFTKNIYKMEWQNDFSIARNFALSHCNCQWILSLDTDEILDTPDLLHKLTTTEKEAYFLPIKSLNGSNPDDYSITYVLRLFRNRSHYRFKGCIHEQLTGISDNNIGISEQPAIIHRCLEPKLRNCKRHRNILLLQQQLPGNENEEITRQYYLGCEWLAFHNYRQAYSCFKFVYDQLPDNFVLIKSRAIKRLVASLRGLGNITEALCICLQTVAVFPEYTDIFFEGGIILEQLGEYEVALQWFTTALELKKPPITYQHLNGTGSFLACYHLGYCCQQLHRSAEAITWYEQALAACSSFVYPISGLFILLSAQMHSDNLFEYFVNKGYATTANQQLLLSELFFAAGKPEYAAKLLDISHVDAAPEQVIKYLIYSGQPHKALHVDLNCRQAGYSSAAIDIYIILADLMISRYDQAKARCIEMWKNPVFRYISQAMLLLIKQLNNISCVLPHNFNCTKLIPIWLQILGECQRCSIESFDDIISILKACQLLLSGSPEGLTALVEYWNKEMSNIELLLDTKYGKMRRLYVCQKIQ